MPTKIIISGGGTGGHVFPAIAIAQALKTLRPDIDILFVGAKGKLEMEKVPAAGFPIEGLWISGFQRKLTARNLLFPFRLLSSLWRSRGILRRFRPDAVVGVGGYASGPVLEMATRAGIPTLIQEQNSLPGITNRLLARKVDRICVAYGNMQRFFPAEKVIRTGNPVRSDLIDLQGKRKEAMAHYGLDPEKPVILLVGGSLGARSLNEGVRENYETLRKAERVQLIWQFGKLYAEEFSDCAASQLPNVRALPFLDAMDLAYAAADVVIARAGALTISELELCGKPAILVPSPNVAEDHQTRNAEALVTEGSALMVTDAEAQKAISLALELLEDRELKQQLEAGIRKRGRPDAARHIAAEVLKLAQKKKA